MADTIQPQVVLSGDQYAREQLAREMAALKDSPLDQAPAGGRYQGADGTLHDAEGRTLSEDSDTSSTSSDFGPDFPGFDALSAGGFDSLEKVRAASDEDLLALDGVGPATLQKIRDAQGA